MLSLVHVWRCRYDCSSVPGKIFKKSTQQFPTSADNNSVADVITNPCQNLADYLKAELNFDFVPAEINPVNYGNHIKTEGIEVRPKPEDKSEIQATEKANDTAICEGVFNELERLYSDTKRYNDIKTGIKDWANKQCSGCGISIPWAVDFKQDAELNYAVELIDKIVIELKAKKLSDEQMAVCLFWLTYYPQKGENPQDGGTSVMKKIMQDVSQSLAKENLEWFYDYLSQNGGLGLWKLYYVKDDAKDELSAKETLLKREGACTEATKALYAVLKYAGLSPVFVEVHSGLTEDDEPSILKHVCIGIDTDNKFRLLDIRHGTANARHKKFYRLSPRQYFILDLANAVVGRDNEASFYAFIFFLGNDPPSYLAHFNRASLLSKKKTAESHKAVIELLNESIVLNPSYPDSRYALGKCLKNEAIDLIEGQNGNKNKIEQLFAEALNQLTVALKLELRSDFYIEIGSILRVMKEIYPEESRKHRSAVLTELDALINADTSIKTKQEIERIEGYIVKLSGVK